MQKDTVFRSNSPLQGRQKEIIMSRSKIATALKTAKIGDCVHTALHLLEVAALPDDIMSGLTGKQIGAMIDGLWRVAQNSKAVATREAIDEGAIWDHKRQALREIA